MHDPSKGHWQAVKWILRYLRSTVDVGLVFKQDDNQSAIHLAKNQVFHARTKHIDVRYHFVREILEEEEILLQKIHTAENPADMLTKVVTKAKFEHCLNLVNILHI
jgi:hypothetical protein